MGCQTKTSGLFSIVVFGFAISIPAQNWVQLPGAPKEGDGVYFTSADTGYIVGGQYGIGNDTIFNTIDGGTNWTIHPVPIRVRCVYFVTPEIGYAGGGSSSTGSDSNHILKTIDGGMTWTGQYKGPPRPAIRSVYFPNKDTGFGVGDDSLILKTTDGGATWTRFTQDMGIGYLGTFESVHCTSVNTCYAVGGGSDLKTTDGGSNWVTMPSPSTKITSIYFLNVDTGYAVGYRSLLLYGEVWRIIKTEDGGTTWNIVLDRNYGPGIPTRLYSIHCINSSTCYAGGVSGAATLADSNNFVWTSDGGNTWTIQRLGRGKPINSIHFPTSTVGYAVGEEGVWKIDLSVVPVSPAKPFFSHLNITDNHLRYSIPIPAKVQILLFDLGGRQTLRLFDGPQAAGEHALVLPVAAGLQILDFRAGEKRRVVKVLPR